MTNRLAAEKSPYLLQHAENPVDWHPWGETAFAKAKAEDKPVFLSIGYATCHWCHVMEKESFMDEGVAALLNDLFVSVKVDREERPDVDQVYMRVCQALNGSGGWPLTVIMTPEGEPFFAATYIPRDPRGNYQGLTGLLAAVGKMWREDRTKLIEAAGRLSHAVRISNAQYPGASDKAYDRTLFSKAAAQLSASYDQDHGGFGKEPKFPTPHNVLYLLRRHRATGSAHLESMASHTLRAMRAGGIWDHVGGGFHRYATDRAWLVPHFEKMLYDQAGLAVAYLEGYQLTGSLAFLDTVNDTLGYIASTLSDPAGGFFCGEDADSEGVEGRFYLWTREEILSLLGTGEGEQFCRNHGVTAEGNYRETPGGKPTGQNVLSIPDPVRLEFTAAQHKNAYAALFAAREKRARPFLDDKVLTGWSAFAASAFARAGGALGREDYVSRAEKAVEFLLGKMMSGGRLLRRYRGGEAGIPAFLEDYGHLSRACLDLYSATLKAAHLENALMVAQTAWELFSAEDGGLHDTPADGEKLLFRPREATDSSMPSPTSVALETFARLHLVTDDAKWQERAGKIMAAEAGLVENFPSAFTHFLQGASLVAENARTLTIEGTGDEAGTRKLLGAALAVYAPDTQVRAGSEEGAAKAVLCDRTACLADISDISELARELVKPSR